MRIICSLLAVACTAGGAAALSGQVPAPAPTPPAPSPFSEPADAPFTAGLTDAAAMTGIVDGRLAKARQLRARMLTVSPVAWRPSALAAAEQPGDRGLRGGDV